MKEYGKKARDSNPNVRLRYVLRGRLWSALTKKNIKKTTSVMELTGCSIDFLKHHLESLFLEGMSWDNYGTYGWHVDHILPCASFDLSDPEQQKICFHYTNLQPLWREDNLSKGARIVA